MHGLYCFDSATVETTLAPFTNTTLDSAAIHRAADSLMHLYRDAGYFATTVYVPPRTSTTASFASLL